MHCEEVKLDFQAELCLEMLQMYHVACCIQESGFNGLIGWLTFVSQWLRKSCDHIRNTRNVVKNGFQPSVKADKSYHGHASSSIPSCSYTVSICPRFFCDLWLFLSLLWCEPSTKYSSTYAGFSAECLPPCISMHFTHKHTDILSEPSCSFNFLHYLTFARSVAFFFFFFFGLVHGGECTSHSQQGFLLVHTSPCSTYLL